MQNSRAVKKKSKIKGKMLQQIPQQEHAVHLVVLSPSHSHGEGVEGVDGYR